jgi:hypothetical protein
MFVVSCMIWLSTRVIGKFIEICVISYTQGIVEIWMTKNALAQTILGRTKC